MTDLIFPNQFQQEEQHQICYFFIWTAWICEAKAQVYCTHQKESQIDDMIGVWYHFDTVKTGRCIL